MPNDSSVVCDHQLPELALFLLVELMNKRLEFPIEYSAVKRLGESRLPLLDLIFDGYCSQANF